MGAAGRGPVDDGVDALRRLRGLEAAGGRQGRAVGKKGEHFERRFFREPSDLAA